MKLIILHNNLKLIKIGQIGGWGDALTECMLCKSEDLSLAPQHLCKKLDVEVVCCAHLLGRRG